MNRNQSQQYQTQQIMTASPAMLVFMLYDKALNCLKEAVRAIEAGEVEARWKANGRAMEIIEHLRVTLNMEAGGEIASNLDQLYSALLRELPKVDLKNDPVPAEKAIKLLTPLRDSWRTVAESGEEATRQAAQTAQQRNPVNPPATASRRPSREQVQPPEGPQGGIKISA